MKSPLIKVAPFVFARWRRKSSSTSRPQSLSMTRLRESFLITFGHSFFKRKYPAVANGSKRSKVYNSYTFIWYKKCARISLLNFQKRCARGKQVSCMTCSDLYRHSPKLHTALAMKKNLKTCLKQKCSNEGGPPNKARSNKCVSNEPSNTFFGYQIDVSGYARLSTFTKLLGDGGAK